MRRPLVLAVALALALALPAAGGATIVPQQGMAGIRLGLTQARVKSVLGEPLRVVHGSNDFGPYTVFRYPYRVRVSFQGDERVTSIRTTGTHERTKRGIGVGSTEADVQANVAGVRCETIGTFRECYVGSYEPGARVTAFDVEAGLVASVTVGFVID